MARPLSKISRKVLRQVRKAGSSLDELSARTGLRKERLAKVLWHLQTRGWISASEEMRALAVYRRLRPLPKPTPTRAPTRNPGAAHLVALQGAFGSRLPARRARGRVVRTPESG